MSQFQLLWKCVNVFNQYTGIWVWPTAEVGHCWDPQSLSWASGRWGAVTPATVLQPGAPFEHSCLRPAAGEPRLLEHRRGCNQVSVECRRVSIDGGQTKSVCKTIQGIGSRLSRILAPISGSRHICCLLWQNGQCRVVQSTKFSSLKHK